MRHYLQVEDLELGLGVAVGVRDLGIAHSRVSLRTKSTVKGPDGLRACTRLSPRLNHQGIGFRACSRVEGMQLFEAQEAPLQDAASP